jgi:hypothetical protein
MRESNVRVYSPNSYSPKESQVLPDEPKRLVELARKNHWPFQVIGRAPLPEKPVRLLNWLIVPSQQDSTIIPQRTMDRIQAIFSAGIDPKGFVLVHEAPMQLKAPATHKSEPQAPFLSEQAKASALKTTTSFLALAGVGMSTLISLLLPMLLMLFSVAMVDPILIAVTKDDYWIEIDRWYSE